MPPKLQEENAGLESELPTEKSSRKANTIQQKFLPPTHFLLFLFRTFEFTNKIAFE